MRSTNLQVLALLLFSIVPSFANAENWRKTAKVYVPPHRVGAGVKEVGRLTNFRTNGKRRRPKMLHLPILNGHVTQGVYGRSSGVVMMAHAEHRWGKGV